MTICKNGIKFDMATVIVLKISGLNFNFNIADVTKTSIHDEAPQTHQNRNHRFGAVCKIGNLGHSFVCTKTKKKYQTVLNVKL